MANNVLQVLILVEENIFDDFVEKFIERTKLIRVGDPLDDDTEIGPLASESHMKRVLNFADIAKKEGGLLTGGARREDLGRGFFIEPTATIALTNDSRVAQQEIFGPFATFIKFSNLEEALHIANNTEYGLVSYVWSEHLPTVMAASEALKS